MQGTGVRLLTELCFLYLHFIPIRGVQVEDLVREIPWIWREFQHVLVISGSTSGSKPLREFAEKFRTGLEMMEDSFDGDISKMYQPERLPTYDFRVLTAVIVQASTKAQMQLLLQKFNFSSQTNTANSTSFLKLPEHAFYLILWPPEEIPANKSSALSSRKTYFQEQIKSLNLSIPMDQNVLFVTKNPRNSYYSAYETFSFKSLHIAQKIYSSLEMPSFLYKFIKYKWTRRGDFRGIPLVATAVQDSFYEEEVNLTVGRNGTAQFVSGLAVTIYRNILQRLNFTEALVVGQYILDNANDPSLVSMDIILNNDQADVAVTLSAVIDDKAAVVSLLYPGNINILEAHYSAEPKSIWRFFLTPFDWPIWAFVLVQIVVMLGTVTWYRRATLNRNYVEEAADDEDHTPWYCSLQLDFIWVVGTLCQQGWYDWPKNTPMKILYLVASCAGFLLYAAYSGTMTSQLSVKTPVTLTFEKMLNLSYHFYMENDLGFPIEPNTHPKPIRISTLYNVTESIMAVRSLIREKATLISYPEFFYSSVKRADISDADACNSYTSIKVSKVPQLLSMAVKKNSPLKELLTLQLMRMWETGIIPRLIRQYRTKTHLNCNDENHGLEPQSIGELFLAFLIVSFGMVTSSFILLFEIFMSMLHSPGRDRGTGRCYNG